MAGTIPVLSVRSFLFVLCRCRWIACLPCTSLVIFQASSEAFIICTIENYFRVVGRSQGGNSDDLYVARKIWLMVGLDNLIKLYFVIGMDLLDTIGMNALVAPMFN